MNLSRKFRHIIPQNTWRTTPCDCPAGFSLWHLLALGLLREPAAREFLESTVGVRGGVILDDLLEHTTGRISPAFWFAASYDKSFGANADILVGLSVEQLCRLQGTTLLGHYLQWESLDWPMHPIVLGFERWIAREVLR